MKRTISFIIFLCCAVQLQARCEALTPNAKNSTQCCVFESISSDDCLRLFGDNSEQFQCRAVCDSKRHHLTGSISGDFDAEVHAAINQPNRNELVISVGGSLHVFS